MILDYMTNLENYEKLLPRMDIYQEYLSKLRELPVGRYELGEGEFFSIQEGTTRPLEGAQFEFHEQYIDLQIMLQSYVQMCCKLMYFYFAINNTGRNTDCFDYKAILKYPWTIHFH